MPLSLSTNFNLKFSNIFEFFTILIFACNFNLSAGNLGLFENGIPMIVKSDNGPPFNADEYERYLKALGIEPDNATPTWPQENAEVERFMQPLKKLMQTSKIKNRYWKQELSIFLLQYRTTPHSTTNVPPAELMFNRTVGEKLPELKK